MPQAVFRVVALWLASPSASDRPDITPAVQEAFASTPSHKWLPLTYQLASRLGTNDGAFQAALHAQLRRMAVEHPFHVLPCLLALANGNRNAAGQQVTPTVNPDKMHVDWDKVNAALQLLQEVREAPGRCEALFEEKKGAADTRDDCWC